MPLVKAQCCNCGSALEVDASKEAAICPFCNTPYIVEKAILNANGSNSINIDNATINISTENVDNLLLRALEFENQENYNKAIEYYNKILDIDFNNESARNGLSRINEKTSEIYIGHTKITLEDKKELIISLPNKMLAIKRVREISGCGLKEAKAFVECGFNDWKECDLSQLVSDSGGSSGGCYVATSVYGSYDCPQVWTLRRFRDNSLANVWYGRLFIKIYYFVSPTIVKWFGDTRWFNNICKSKLDKIVCNLKANGVEDTPYKDKKW